MCTGVCGAHAQLVRGCAHMCMGVRPGIHGCVHDCAWVYSGLLLENIVLASADFDTNAQTCIVTITKLQLLVTSYSYQ